MQVQGAALVAKQLLVQLASVGHPRDLFLTFGAALQSLLLADDDLDDLDGEGEGDGAGKGDDGGLATAVVAEALVWGLSALLGRAQRKRERMLEEGVSHVGRALASARECGWPTQAVGAAAAGFVLSARALEGASTAWLALVRAAAPCPELLSAVVAAGAECGWLRGAKLEATGSLFLSLSLSRSSLSLSLS